MSVTDVIDALMPFAKPSGLAAVATTAGLIWRAQIKAKYATEQIKIQQEQATKRVEAKENGQTERVKAQEEQQTRRIEAHEQGRTQRKSLEGHFKNTDGTHPPDELEAKRQKPGAA